MHRTRWALVACIFVAACFADAPPARGEDASWVGKRVILTKRGVKRGYRGADGIIHDDGMPDTIVKGSRINNMVNDNALSEPRP